MEHRTHSDDGVASRDRRRLGVVRPLTGARGGDDGLIALRPRRKANRLPTVRNRWATCPRNTVARANGPRAPDRRFEVVGRVVIMGHFDLGEVRDLGWARDHPHKRRRPSDTLWGMLGDQFPPCLEAAAILDAYRCRWWR